jgi:hypothetical protein
MKMCTTVLMVLLMASTAVGSLSDDFESYGSPGTQVGSPWGTYYGAGNGAEADPLWVGAGGYTGNSLHNHDGTNQHGLTQALPSIPNLAGGESVELTVLVDASAQSGSGFSYIAIGDSALTGTGSPLENFSGISISAAGTGKLRTGWLGAEPAISLPGTDSGYQEIKIVIYDKYHTGYEFDTTYMDVYSGDVGGALTLRGSYGSNRQFGVSHIALSPNLGAHYDNLSVNVVPEPATMSLLALGGLASLRRRRR